MDLTVLEAALAYAKQGRRVHPCRPDNKKPITAWGSQASTLAYVINIWWSRWPDALIGLCTGDGLVVVDVDPRHGGEFDPDMALTRTATTPGGGWHHYYSTTEPIPNAVGLIPGVDVRGERGYVIAPGSAGYGWLNDNDVLPLPAVVAGLMSDRVSTKRSGAGFEPAPAGSVGEGYRHDYMVRFTGFAIAVLELEDADALAEACIEEYERACSPADAPRANIERIARSILRKHERG